MGGGGTRATTAAALLLALALAVGAAGLGRAEFGARILADPLSDPFEQLSMEDLFDDWMAGEELRLAERLQRLREPLEETIYVSVRLVGVSERVASASEVDAQLQRRSQLGAVPLLRPTPSALGVQRRVLFRTTSGGGALQQSLHDAVAGALERQTAAVGTDAGLVEVDEVDSLLQQDWEKTADDGYVIYVLDSGVAANYSYTDTLPQCSSAGQSGRQRYAWLDLGARPLRYGPGANGEGVAVHPLLPSLRAMGASALGVRKSLPSMVAAFVRRTVALLIAPPLLRLTLPMPTMPVTLVFITVHDHALESGQATHEYNCVDLDLIERELASLALFDNQPVSVLRMEASFAQPAIATAFSMARRLVSSFHHGRAAVHHFVDSAELHYWLQTLGAQILPQSLRGRSAVFPVFLFDISHHELMTFDRRDHMVAFDDMVLMMFVKSTRARFEYKCDGEYVSLSLDNCNRLVLSGLVQTVWGVASNTAAWSAAHERLVDDFVWAVGRGPFGYLSSSQELSFAQRDAARKNQLYALLQAALAELARSLARLEVYGHELSDSLAATDFYEYVQRWNVLFYKLREALGYLSLHKYQNALSHLLSAQHDVGALRRLADSAVDNIRSDLVCAEPQRSWSDRLLDLLGI